MNLVPKKIYPRYGDIGTYTLQFPKDSNEMNKYFAREINTLSGKVIMFRGSNDKYITSNKMEQEFASQQAYLTITSLSDTEVIEWFRDYEKLPHADNSMTIEEASEFLFTDPNEEDTINILKRFGYIKASNEEILKLEKKQARINVKQQLNDIPDKDLISILRDRGYVGFRKSSKG